MSDEPLEITVVPFEFPTAKMALAAFEDLNRWAGWAERIAGYNCYPATKPRPPRPQTKFRSTGRQLDSDPPTE